MADLDPCPHCKTPAVRHCRDNEACDWGLCRTCKTTISHRLHVILRGGERLPWPHTKPDTTA